MLYLLTQDLGVQGLDQPKERLFFSYDKLGVLKTYSNPINNGNIYISRWKKLYLIPWTYILVYRSLKIPRAFTLKSLSKLLTKIKFFGWKQPEYSPEVTIQWIPTFQKKISLSLYPNVDNVQFIKMFSPSYSLTCTLFYFMTPICQNQEAHWDYKIKLDTISLRATRRSSVWFRCKE